MEPDLVHSLENSDRGKDSDYNVDINNSSCV